MFCILAFAGLSLTLSLQAKIADENSSSQSIRIQFVDSATGYAVKPEFVEATPAAGDLEPSRVRRNGVKPGSQTTLMLDQGQHTIKVTAPGYQPMSGEFVVLPENPYNIVFQLDPIEPPRELQPETVAALHRVNETVFVGFLVDEDSGEPLANAVVRTEPSGNETRTDARGYFQIYVPVQTLSEATSSPAKLIFAQPGFRAEERCYLELWSRGDWIYRIRLDRGDGVKTVDERTLRRRSAYPVSVREEISVAPPPVAAQQEAIQIETVMAQAVVGGGISTQQLASTSAHVRIPTNIRVLRQDNVTIDYISLQTYGHRSLPSEWIASWGSVGPGNSGTNSLNAGAVASRTYAVGYVNNPIAATHDICASTSCQVYNQAITDTRTTAAVNFTANYVMLQPGTGRVGFKITEYSAENNQLGMACGDGFTAPTGGCLSDPVCAGEVEFGHGRGMCQWGTARWASGRRMAGGITSDATTNNFPIQNWIWICEHYFPNLVLAQGAPLVIGDDVKVLGTASLSVRQCPGNTITNGTLCPQVATKPADSVGTIIGGPVLVTVDGSGHTWWQVNWGDTNGWSIENNLERVSATPGTPGTLTATPISASQINLTWTDNAANEIGTYIERATTAGGPWVTNAFVRAGITNFSDTGLSPATTNHYRVRTFNQSAVSAYSNITNAITPGIAPVLAAISNRTIVEGALLTFTNSATATDFISKVSDFEGSELMFRLPNFSGSTSAFLSNAPNVTAVTTTFPTGNASARVLNVNWAFTNSAVNPWLRLTTSSATTLPNPVIDFTKWFRFRIWTDKALYVGLGLRETTNAPGTAIGSNGGTAGGIEWAGVTNSVSGQPQPNRTVTASNWTMLVFNLPIEPVRNFASGNGVLSTASGLGVLEHIAFVPAAGNSAYNVYLDDFEVFTSNTLTYSLSNAPAGATINATNGVFTWTTTESQGPGVYDITVRVTDNNLPPASDAKVFQVTVNETNQAPLLATITNRVVHAGTLVLFTNTATDADLPTNSLGFSLDVGAPLTASIGTNTGVFNWQTSDANVGLTNNITVRVTDNGVPPLNDAKLFSIAVLARPSIVSAAVSGGDFTLTWSAIPGQKYRVQFKNNLTDANWSDLVPDVTASLATASINDPVSATQRFYRVLVVAQ